MRSVASNSKIVHKNRNYGWTGFLYFKTDRHNLAQNISTIHNMTQKIIYIRSIAFAEVSAITDFVRVLGDMAVVSIKSEPTDLPLVGLAKCTVSSSVENKSRLWSTVLSARLSELFIADDRHLIFLLTATDGQKYIIGTNSKPQPLVNSSASMPDRSSEPVAYDLSVEYSDIFGLTRLLLRI